MCSSKQQVTGMFMYGIMIKYQQNLICKIVIHTGDGAIWDLVGQSKVWVMCNESHESLTEMLAESEKSPNQD